MVVHKMVKVVRFTAIGLLAFLSAATIAEGPYDDVSTKKASEILPAQLVSSKNFNVQDGVTWNDGLHEFTVETEFGSFTVWGEPMLRVRLKEVDAWIEMKKTSEFEAGLAAAGRQATRSAVAIANAFVHPLRTLEGIPTGIGRMFGKSMHDVDNVARFVAQQKRENSAGSVPGAESQNVISRLGDQLVGVNASYRRLASAYGVNPYTTNKAIQEELLRLAHIDAPISTATKIAMPGMGAVNAMAKVSRAIYEQSWYEILARDEKALEEMGASPAQIKVLFNNDNINLTLLTLMIDILEQWTSVEGRLHVVDQMILLETDAEAVFFAESLLIADWYHDNEAPIARMLPGTLIPVAQSRTGKVVAFSALDYAYWTPEQEATVIEFTDQYESYSDDREAWLADQVSRRFAEAVAELGWKVRSGLRGNLLPEIPWGLQDEELAP